MMKRVVIADDSLTARMFVRRCLEIVSGTELEIVEAANGKEALSAVKENPADLLVTDLNMPVMDGQTLLKWIKGNPRLVDLPVLVITSAGNPAKEKELLDMGAFAVLNKPINPSTLKDKIADLIEQDEL